MTNRYRGSNIQSFMPSTDARASDDIRVIAAQNLAWDSKGPKSGFSTRQLTPFAFGNPKDISGLRIGAYTLVFPPDSIVTWPTTPPYTWQSLYTFPDQIPSSKRSPWQGIYLNGKIYVAQEYRGLLSGTPIPGDGRLRFKLESDSTIPGLIGGIQGLNVVRQRAILVSNDVIQWSNTADLSTLAPGLGGAGFQAISQITKGSFLALTAYEDGFIVWTTEGAVSAEYIGGDAVWRFDTLFSTDRPIGKNTVVTPLTGGSIYLSQQGVHMLQNKNVSQPLSPDFNEFLRTYMEDSTNSKRQWRLEYDYNRQQIFIMESTDLVSYHNTFVLYPTLSRWGIFSDRVLGFLPLSNDLYGYIDNNGIPNYFIHTINRGIEPSNSYGLTRKMPRLEKLDAFPTSSAVSNDFPMAATVANEPSQAGWFRSEDDSPQPGDVKGMDSWVEIGYFRPQELVQSTSSVSEISQIDIGSISSMPLNTFDPGVIASDLAWFTYTIDNFNTEGAGNSNEVYNLGGVDQDYNTGGIDEDWQTIGVTDDDYNNAGADEDWQWWLSGLPTVSLALTVKSSDDGFTYENPAFVLSRFYTGLWHFTGISNHGFNVLRITADAINGYYHIKYLELELGPGGKTN